MSRGHVTPVARPTGRGVSAWWYAAIAAAFLVGFGVMAMQVGWANLWLTPDQQGERLLREGRFEDAARRFADPMRQGVGWFRAGRFEAADQAFHRAQTAEAAFNRGNALVMQGKYEDAVAAYDQALERRPDWAPATDNREIARLRAERVRAEGGDMTGGQLGADDYSFDTGRQDSESGELDTSVGDQGLSNEALRALWLRRVQTKPADFLRAKFAYQLATGEQDASANP